ncbi:MAG: hypothetical protein IIC81_08130 [Chloroflexi bacterium]|nr:hypothetical protein [Chloroflexota bacterium]
MKGLKIEKILLTKERQAAAAQKESKIYKIAESKWPEMTHDFKTSGAFKNTGFRYGIDTYKEVLGGGILTKRTIYSNSSCNCILLIINYKKGEPFELVHHLFKFKKHYNRDKLKWRFEKRVDRVGFQRCL